MSSVLKQLQDDCAARLRGDSWFAAIAVVTEDQADLDAVITAALATSTETGGAIGAAVLVLQPEADVAHPNVQGPRFEPVRLRLHCLEQLAVNRDTAAGGTGKPSYEMGENVLRVLHQFGDAGDRYTVVYAASAAMRPLAPSEMLPGIIGYEVLLQANTGLDAPSKVETPAISPAGGAVPQTVMLSCGTSGSSIYYTTDGGYPGSGNTGATLYSAPFVLAAAATMRVGAQKTGMVPSDVEVAVFT